MAKIINLIFVLFLYTNAFAQIGGTQAVEDTMRLANKFAVYKIALGQRLDASKANTDTIQVTALLDVPEGGLPTCEASRQGNLMMSTVNNRLYFCNGSSWGLVAYDADLDGLTSAIDANEAVAFTAGTAAASNVMSGFTFYTGAGMTETTGTIPTYGGALSNGGSISSGSYTPANFPFTLQTNNDYVDKDLTINNPTNLSATNVRIGVGIAGNTGTYPSSGNRLNGNTATPDVTAATLLVSNEGFQSDGTLVTGSMPNNGAGSFTADGGYAAGYYSGITVDVVASGTGDTDASGAQIRSGYEAWNSTGGLVDGTMPDNGSATFDTDGTKSAGYYSGITVDVIHPGTGDTNAGGGQILSGYEAWSELGDLVDGTMPDNGAGSFTSDGSKPAGYYSSISVDVVASGTGDTDAGGAQILAGYEAWGSTGSLIDGTMPDRGSPTFSTDDVSLDAGYYSGGTVSVIDAGTADTDAAGAQILSGYEAWDTNGSVVDGTMPDRGAGLFVNDGNYNYGYYSGITVDVLDAGTGSADADDAQVRSGYEYWTSTGQRRLGSLSTQAGGNYTPVTGTAGSYTVATGDRYLSGDVTINRVSATTTISHGNSSGDGPWKSVSCTAVTLGFGVTAPSTGSGGTSIGNGQQITITANEGDPPQTATYHCGGYSSCNSCCGCGDVGGAECNCPTCSSCVGAAISSPSFFTGQVGDQIPNGQTANLTTCGGNYRELYCAYGCPSGQTCHPTNYIDPNTSGFNVTYPQSIGTGGTAINMTHGQQLTISTKAGNQLNQRWACPSCPTCNAGLTSTADIEIYVGDNATVTANNGDTRTVYCKP